MTNRAQTPYMHLYNKKHLNVVRILGSRNEPSKRQKERVEINAVFFAGNELKRKETIDRSSTSSTPMLPATQSIYIRIQDYLAFPSPR